MSSEAKLSVAVLDVLSAAQQAFKTGAWSEAILLFEKAVAGNASLRPAYLGLARCAAQMGRWPQAREGYAQALRLDASDATVWLEAGQLCRNMGELVQAAGAYQRAMDLAPERYEPYLGIACVLAQQGQQAQCNRAYNAAVQAAAAVGPTAVLQVHWLMGQAVLALGFAQEALACLGEAMRIALKHQTADGPANALADVQIDAAKALLRLGERRKAEALMTLASASTQAATLTRLSELSYHHNFTEEAIAVARRCSALYPENAVAHWNLAYLLAECWQMDEAEEVLQRAQTLGPVAGAASLRASIQAKLGHAEQALAMYTDLAAREGPDSAHASSAAMCSLYSDETPVHVVADLHRRLFASWGQGARARESFVRQPLAGRRLRVGWISADLHHQHPVNIFMQPILRELDRSQIELFIYFVGDAFDEQTALARSRTEHWLDATKLKATQLAKKIDVDGIDLLVDLSGHTNHNRLGLFAQRAAPVQMTYLGYPASTGLPNMDVILGDPVVTPVGCEALYSETVIRLPATVFCYAPEEHYPLPLMTAEWAQRPLTFGSFNNLPKLTPRTLRLWARVLEAVPGSRLVLKAPSFGDTAAKRVFSERLLALGVDLNRVDLRGPVGLSDMMAEYADIDIALDPVPYNGGTTTLQAMWMGVPVVTQAGEHFASRMGASFMSSAGLSDWVGQGDDDYVAIAARMAKDRISLLRLKSGLRERLQKLPGWDAVAHTRAMELAWVSACS